MPAGAGDDFTGDACYDSAMRDNTSLNTGEYDPKTYWSARARQSEGDCFDAVCVYRATPAENRCVDRVQARVLAGLLAGVDLSGKDVLEYGCGAGRWVDFFTRRGARWAGVDISPDMLTMARERHDDVRAELVDDGRIPFDDDAFDLVYSVTVVHHNDYVSQQAILREMLRVLRPGGRLVMLEDIDRGGSRFNMFPRTRPGWEEFAASQGLRLIRRRGVRYWFLRQCGHDVVNILRGLVRKGPVGPGEKATLWRRLIGPIDAAVDPYIVPLLPHRMCIADAMLFERVQAGGEQE